LPCYVFNVDLHHLPSKNLFNDYNAACTDLALSNASIDNS